MRSPVLRLRPLRLFRGLRCRNIARGKTQASGYANGVFWVGAIEVADLALDDFHRYAVHRRLDVVEQLLFLRDTHQAKQVAGLAVVVVSVPMVVAVGIAR